MDHELIEAINKLAVVLSAPRPFSITQASDWQIILVFGGAIVALVGVMWRDLKATIKEDKGGWEKAIAVEKTEREKDVDRIWSAMRACQEDCCPRRHADGGK